MELLLLLVAAAAVLVVLRLLLPLAVSSLLQVLMPWGRRRAA